MMFFAARRLLPLIVLIPALAQRNAPPVTIRSTTTLVQVNAVAHDAGNRAVDDLAKEDFELLEDGKPKPIAVFIRERTVAATRNAPEAPAGYFSNGIVANPTARGGYSIILLDYANTGFRNTARARQKAIEMVNRLGPAERVGLYTLDRSGVHIAAEPGTDRPALLAKLATTMGMPSPCFQRQLDGLDDSHDDSMANCGGPGPLAGELKSFLVNKRITDTLLALESIAGHLSGLPGRKGLLWISSAFPLHIELRAPASELFPEAQGGYQMYDSEIGRAMRKLNNAEVTLYPIDARALSTGSPVNDDDFTVPTMDFFAARTGGVAFHGRNNLDDAMQAAIEDVQTSYTLGFYASQDPERSGFHSLKLRSLRPGVTLRYKEGYYVEPPPKQTASVRKEAVSEAMTALMDATAIPIQASLARERNTATLRIRLEPASLALERKGERWQGRIDVIVRFAREDGSQAAEPSLRRVEFNLSQQKYETALRDGLVFSTAPVVPPSARRLRLLVRGSSGGIGSLTIPL